MESAKDLMQCFQNLITSGDEIYSDFTVKVEHEVFHCHKFILSSCSPFFRALFRTDMQETRLNCATLKAISSATFKLIYDCIYFNVDRLNEGNFLDVWMAAHFMQIDFIVSACQKIAIRTINERNCHRYFWYARLLDNKVMVKISEYITCNFDRFKDSRCLMDLEGEEFLTIVRDDRLNTSREENVVGTILKWVHHSNINERVDFFIPLMSAPRLNLLRLRNQERTFNHMLTLDKSRSRDLISNISNYILGGRLNYWSAFSSPRKRVAKEDVVMVQTGLQFIDIYSLSDNKIAGMIDSSVLPSNAVLGSHRRQIYACAYTGYNKGWLSMFLLQDCTWQKVSSVGLSDDIIQQRLQPQQQHLFTFSIRDRVFVVQANGHIFEWHPVKRTGLKQMTSVPCRMPTIYASDFKSSILVICSDANTTAVLNVYDTTRQQWGAAVAIDGVRFQGDIVSFYKEDVLYLLTSKGKLYRVDCVGGGFLLNHVTTIANFNLSIADAIIYRGGMFLFVKERAYSLVNEKYPKSLEFPELFNEVYLIGTRYSCTSVLQTSLPKLI